MNPCIGGHKSDAYWRYDAKGIPLAKVCKDCVTFKLSKFRPEVINNANYWADEVIDSD